MNLGEKLINLRKEKNLSQEEVADILNVSRQTISKWETNQSTPDFDKLGPITKLYNISADELLDQSIKENKAFENNKETIIKKKAKGISISIFLYFLSVIWLMISIPVMDMDPIIASAIFMGICGLATYIIVYTCMIYKTNTKKENNNTYKKQINHIITSIFLIIYLLFSFMTMAWHITWIIWIIYALVLEINKLIFMLRGKENEK